MADKLRPKWPSFNRGPLTSSTRIFNQATESGDNSVPLPTRKVQPAAKYFTLRKTKEEMPGKRPTILPKPTLQDIKPLSKHDENDEDEDGYLIPNLPPPPPPPVQGSINRSISMENMTLKYETNKVKWNPVVNELNSGQNTKPPIIHKKPNIYKNKISVTKNKLESNMQSASQNQMESNNITDDTCKHLENKQQMVSQECENEKKNLKSQLDGEKMKRRSQFNEEKRELQEQFEEEKRNLQEQFEEEKRNLQEQFDKDISSFQQEFENEIITTDKKATMKLSKIEDIYNLAVNLECEDVKNEYEAPVYDEPIISPKQVRGAADGTTGTYSAVPLRIPVVKVRGAADGTTGTYNAVPLRIPVVKSTQNRFHPQKDISELERKKLEEKIDGIKDKIIQETEARDGLMKIKTVYEANPTLGDPESIEEQLSKIGPSLDKLRADLKIANGYLDTVDGKGGPASPASTLPMRVGKFLDGVQIGNMPRLFKGWGNSEPQQGLLSSRSSNNPESGLGLSKLSLHGGDGETFQDIDEEEEFSEEEEFDELEPVQTRCSAIYPFAGVFHEGSITIKKGEELLLIQTDQGDGWTKVRRLNPSHLDQMPEGLVPTTYIHINTT